MTWQDFQNKLLLFPQLIGALAYQPFIQASDDDVLVKVESIRVEAQTVEDCQKTLMLACLDYIGNQAVFVRKMPEVYPVHDEITDEFKYYRGYARLAAFDPEEMKP